MKRLRRWLFNLAALVSLLLCVATLVDRWVQQRYFHWFGLLTWRAEGSTRITRELGVTAAGGLMYFTATTMADEASSKAPASCLDYGLVFDQQPRSPAGNSLLGQAGFGASVQSMAKGNNGGLYYTGLWSVTRLITLPTWFVALVFAILPACALVRRKQFASGCCKNCGYDLRATPERCPECGHVAGVGAG